MEAQGFCVDLVCVVCIQLGAARLREIRAYCIVAREPNHTALKANVAEELALSILPHNGNCRNINGVIGHRRQHDVIWVCLGHRWDGLLVFDVPDLTNIVRLNLSHPFGHMAIIRKTETRRNFAPQIKKPYP